MPVPGREIKLPDRKDKDLKLGLIWGQVSSWSIAEMGFSEADL